MVLLHEQRTHTFRGFDIIFNVCDMNGKYIV